MGSGSDESIQIRRAVAGDASGIARVRVVSWRATYQGLVTQEVLDGLSVEQASSWIEATIRSHSPGSCNLVARDRAGQIVGFALGGPERTGDPEYSGELYALYLLPEYLRIGIGSRLLLNMADELLQQGMDSMLIWVLAKNPARKFYEAMGGVYIRQQQIMIGHQSLIEAAYGWLDLEALSRKYKGVGPS